jgi:trk system potassium uptake protein TrkH
VILAGTWLLMMPFTASAGSGLSLTDALFTATSAVCVTGLVVVDTAVYFSFWGKLVIMILIQIGGLGIMVLSYFTLFIMGKRISVEQKSLVSYMLSEDDMGNLKRTLMSIIGITAIIEGAGMLILFAGSAQLGLSFAGRIFFGMFHSISAFCNAGFALFSDSLESFSASPLLLLTLAVLIISGGLSFGVFVNIRDISLFRIRRFWLRLRRRHEASSVPPVLSLNSHVVLSFTFFLLLSGTLLFYALEHKGTLRNLPLGRQYLAAFFQSVTLRTAGFNSVPFGALSGSILVVMIIFMFIGGASGSTAGGIKVNTLAVIFSAIRRAWRNDPQVTIRSKTLATELVSQAFLIFLFGIGAVALGTFILSITEIASLDAILFETVSAFATVGLTIGLTPNLSIVGKVVIITLMFLGRLGPLTVLAASRSESQKLQITYPLGNITVG